MNLRVSKARYWIQIALAFLMALLLASPYGLMAQETLHIDMASAARLAAGRNWTARKAHQDVATAGDVVKATESMRWGRINFDAQYLRLNDPVQIESPIPANLVPVLGLRSLTTPLGPQDSLHADLRAGIPVFTGGKLTYAIREAKAGKEATAAAASDVDDDVVLDAERCYLSVLLAREVVKLNQQALETYQKHLEHAHSAFRLGVAANYDVVRAEAAVKEQERRLIEASNQEDLATAALRNALALEDSPPIEIAGNLIEIGDPVDLNAAMASAMHSNSLMKALDAKLIADKDAVHAQEADYLPQITGIAGRELVTSKLNQTDPTWFAGARANLNLFDGGERRARVAVEKSRLQKTDFERHHAEEQIRLAVRSAYLNLQSQRAAFNSATKAVELNQESLRLATKRFEVGTGTSLEVLDATVSLTASQTSRQQALFGIDLAYLSLHRYQGDISQIASRIQ